MIDALRRYGLPYHGLSGLQVGFLVAFTQLIPEHQLQLFGALKLRVKVSVPPSTHPTPADENTLRQTLPGIYLLVSNVLVFLFGPSPYMLVQFGFFVAWVYLRFFKLSESGDFRGDRNETFAFQYWFPPPIRYCPSSHPSVCRLINATSDRTLRSRVTMCTRWPCGLDWCRHGRSLRDIVFYLDRDRPEQRRNDEGECRLS